MKIILSFLLLFTHILCAQNASLLISGKVSDKQSGESIAFATIGIKNTPLGTLSNDEGAFELRIPETNQSDTLLISFLGYESRQIPVKAITGALKVELNSSSVALKEVVIKPLSAEEYMKLVIRNIRRNYPEKPFGTEAYYRNQLKEEGNMIKRSEGIFRSYYPEYLDTARNQHQLVLYQKDDSVKKIQFMKKASDKEKSRKKTSGTKSPGNTSTSNSSREIVNVLGGPETILSLDPVKSLKESFLDSAYFKKFEFAIEGQSSYQDRPLLIISFRSRGKINKVRSAGRLYIDLENYAIAQAEMKGELVLPVTIRPLLFLMGLGIHNPAFEQRIAYLPLNGKWYPRDLYFSLNIELIKKHMFSPNEHSNFVIEQVFTANNIFVNNPSPIPPEKRFDPAKKIETQVMSDNSITWADRNVIKR